MGMSWWHNTTEYLRRSKSETPQESPDIKFNVTGAVVESVIDFLFYILGAFTYIYFFGSVYLFFFRGGAHYELLAKLTDAFTEPYLGAVGIYVILKEIRKSRFQLPSQHRGEIFVFLWLLFLFVASALVLFSPSFHFDERMSRIITVSLALLVIYIGGIIHKS